jgi:hypothetical protein
VEQILVLVPHKEPDVLGKKLVVVLAVAIPINLLVKIKMIHTAVAALGILDYAHL